MLQRNVLLTGAMAALIGLTIGCEWTGTDSEEAWNDAYSWVNFSGTYRLYVVNVPEDGDTSPDEPDPVTEINVVDENQGTTGSDPKDTFTGTLRNRPIVAGSVTITIAGASYSDNASGGLTGGADGTDGTIVYGTGAWMVRTLGHPELNQPIRASYTYLRSGTVINPSQPGSAGSTLTQITINQQGNLLTFTDNNGVVYNGRTTGANVPSDSRTAGNVRLNFEVSAANGAKIIGTLSGDWSGGANGTLSNRLLRGTYIRGGTRVEVQGTSGSVAITPMPITSD